MKSPNFTNIGSCITENILHKINQPVPWENIAHRLLRSMELNCAWPWALQTMLSSCSGRLWRKRHGRRYSASRHSSTCGASCGFLLTLPCLLGPICCVLPFLSDGLPDAWQGSLLIPSVLIPFNQISEHNLWYFPSLACSHIDTSNLCHSEYPKLLQM